jgi:heme/copper-type cytochrome/quinol oxidase subunit 2
MIVSSPAVVDGVVYVGSYDHLVYAVGVPSTEAATQNSSSFIVVLLSVVAVLIVVAVLAVWLYRRNSKVNSEPAVP